MSTVNSRGRARSSRSSAVNRSGKLTPPLILPAARPLPHPIEACTNQRTGVSIQRPTTIRISPHHVTLSKPRSTCSTYEILLLTRVILMYVPGSDERYVNAPVERDEAGDPPGSS